MKAKFETCLAKRSLVVVAAAALPSLCVGIARAQTAEPPAQPSAPPAPAVVSPAPTSAAATGATPSALPATVEPPPGVVMAPGAPDTPPAPPAVPPSTVDPDAEKYKHIDVGVWFRLGAALQKSGNPKKLSEFGSGGDVELHFSNQMRKTLLWTANFTATYGAPDGGSYHPGGGVVTGDVNVLDLIAQWEPDDAFHLWAGRMLVASDRSNFSGPWFMAPWIYPLFLGPQDPNAAFAIVGPKEGPYGRNDGATVWGQFQGGMLKYYLGVYNVYDAAQKPLISGRLNLSLLNPEPGYYSSSTYYGMDILAIGVGGQYQKNGDPDNNQTGAPAAGARTDYGLFNADVLFEKNLGESGVFDAEGAFYKYIGDGQSLSYSYFGLLSYLTPETGMGKFQPLVRLQQANPKADGADTITQIDGQVSYVVDSYATRMTLGFAHASAGGDISSNSLFAGVQIQK